MFKKIDDFTKNIIFVFLGTSLASFLNLVYQLLIAHQLSAIDFAAFNALLSIFTIISVPMVNLNTAVIKFTSEFNAKNEINKIRSLLSELLKKASTLAFFTFIILFLFAPVIVDKLKISSYFSVYILIGMTALSWIMPVFTGALQGLELFKWLVLATFLSGVVKLLFTLVFLKAGYNINGALGAFLIAVVTGILISYQPLRHLFRAKDLRDRPEFKKVFLYLFPVITATLSFSVLVNVDMVLVKYYFSQTDSGVYALAQLLGKIFLFLPSAIGIVMFPRISGLNAKNADTATTLKHSLIYTLGLSIIAFLVYNLFPGFILKVLTGKAPAESIILGRLFSVSMTFFTLIYIFVLYFLSLRSFKFVKYLVLSAVLQIFAIGIFHQNLLQVQFILLINSILLFCIYFLLAFKYNRTSIASPVMAR